MSIIRVLHTEDTHSTRDADPGDDWDRGETQTYHTVYGIEEASKQTFADLDVAYEVQPDTPYYLLSVVYSTGNSFGHEEGGRIEFIGLYKSYAEAQNNELLIHQHNTAMINNRKSREPLMLVSPSGTTYQVYVPWHGYFENLDSVRIDNVQLQVKTS